MTYVEPIVARADNGVFMMGMDETMVRAFQAGAPIRLLLREYGGTDSVVIIYAAQFRDLPMEDEE